MSINKNINRKQKDTLEFSSRKAAFLPVHNGIWGTWQLSQCGDVRCPASQSTQCWAAVNILPEHNQSSKKYFKTPLSANLIDYDSLLFYFNFNTIISSILVLVIKVFLENFRISMTYLLSYCSG